MKIFKKILFIVLSICSSINIFENACWMYFESGFPFHLFTTVLFLICSMNIIFIYVFKLELWD